MIFGKRITATYSVEGMMCGKCASRVENALLGVQGVKKVTADFQTGNVLVVSVRALEENEVKTVIEGLGYAFKGIVK